MTDGSWHFIHHMILFLLAIALKLAVHDKIRRQKFIFMTKCKELIFFSATAPHSPDKL